MAIINKTGITDGGTIQAEHVTRAIDALSGGSTDTIVATGSFSGSLRGVLTGTASFATSASYAPQLFTFVTGSTYSNVDTNTNIDLSITGSVSTYTVAGAKGFQRYTNAINTLGVFGELIAADTSGVDPYTLVYLDYNIVKWQTVEQPVYDPDSQPLMGISLDGKSAGTVLLNGFITAYASGSTSGSGVQLEEAVSRLGYAVWADEGSGISGSMSTTKPTGGGAIINVGHIIASGSTVATSKNYLIRVNPRYISTI